MERFLLYHASLSHRSSKRSQRRTTVISNLNSTNAYIVAEVGKNAAKLNMLMERAVRTSKSQLAVKYPSFHLESHFASRSSSIFLNRLASVLHNLFPSCKAALTFSVTSTTCYKPMGVAPCTTFILLVSIYIRSLSKEALDTAQRTFCSDISTVSSKLRVLCAAECILVESCQDLAQ